MPYKVGDLLIQQDTQINKGRARSGSAPSALARYMLFQFLTANSYNEYKK